MNMSDIAASFQDVDYTDLSSWPAVLKIVVSLLIGIGILVAMYMLLYQPKLDELKLATDEEISLRAEFSEKQRLAVNLPAYKEQMIEIKERFDKVLRQLPEASEVPALLVDISEAGLEQGLVFQRFKPSKAEQKNFYVRLPIQIQASGTYHQLAGFISAIANFQRVVTVGDLEIIRAKSSGAGSVNEVDLTPLAFKATIYTYHFSETNTGVDEKVLRVQQ
jgi:type IV pilus assembly protein PilO